MPVCRIASKKRVQHPETVVFLCMTDKHANLCLFPCLFSFPLRLACYYNFPCGVDTEKFCFDHIQTIVYYFLKGTVNNFSCVLLVLFMSLFLPHSDDDCRPFPWFSFPSPAPMLFPSRFCLMWLEKGLGRRRVQTE